MKNLENFIRQNRTQLDKEEPPKGHYNRFWQRIHVKRRTSHYNSWKFVLKAAVVSILVIISGLWVYERTQENRSPERFVLESISPEIKEAHTYYTSEMEKKYDQIKRFDFQNKNQKKLLINELQDMDSIYINIKEDLRTNPNDPRVINALIRHYQMKLEVMNHILRQLKEIQKQTQSEKRKENNHENI